MVAEFQIKCHWCLHGPKPIHHPLSLLSFHATCLWIMWPTIRLKGHGFANLIDPHLRARFPHLCQKTQSTDKETRKTSTKTAVHISSHFSTRYMFLETCIPPWHRQLNSDRVSSIIQIGCDSIIPFCLPLIPIQVVCVPLFQWAIAPSASNSPVGLAPQNLTPTILPSVTLFSYRCATFLVGCGGQILGCQTDRKIGTVSSPDGNPQVSCAPTARQGNDS